MLCFKLEKNKQTNKRYSMKEIDADCPNNLCHLNEIEKKETKILSTNSHTVHRSIDIHRN